MDNKYLAYHSKNSLHYVKRILHKYHKTTEKLSQLFYFYTGEPTPEIKEYSTFIGELEYLQSISEDGVIGLELMEDINMNAFARLDENGKLDMLEIFDFSHLNDTEKVSIYTLAVIVYKYCCEDFHTYFARHAEDNMSDKASNDHDKKYIEHAYTSLKNLKNLLLFKEEGYKKNVITIDNIEEREIKKEENIKKRNPIDDPIDNPEEKEKVKTKAFILKENQILINDSKRISKIVHLLIQDELENILITPNEYIDSYILNSYTADTITFEIANREFEKVRYLVEKTTKVKQPSQRAVFKGLISKLVKKYIKDEQITFAEKLIDERDAQLIAYKLLSMFGFISLDLINSHHDRNARIKYMDSLPTWEGNPILSNEMTFISPEDYIQSLQ